MNELIKVNQAGDRQTTSARDLWEFLDRPYTKFTDWFNQYKGYGFIENEDYRGISEISEKPLGGRPPIDYEITIDMAKELAMLQKTEKGKQARQYFIEVEKRHKGQLPIAQLSPQLQVLNQMLQAMANIEIEQRQIAARLDKSEQTLSAVKETFLQRDENWRQSINLMINRIAHEGRDYREIKSDSYMRLEERAGCNLNQRLRNLKDRLQHEGATKTKVDNVNRLDVIEQEKRLKAIYDTIVKEMALEKV